MDLILDILVPKDNFHNLNLNEIFVEWEGDNFSQIPRKYKYKSTVFFHENTEMSYYENIIEDVLNVHDCIALTLDGESLLELEFIVNNEGFSKNKSELIPFFYELYNSLETFCIIKLLNEEHIDNKYLISNANDAVDVFIKSLSWDSPKGIVIIKKS